MGALSLRLPDDLEARLAEEAGREGRPRSEVAREAIAEYLARRERERFMGELVAEARAGYADEVGRDEARELAEAFQQAENEALATVEAGEAQDGKTPWWK